MNSTCQKCGGPRLGGGDALCPACGLELGLEGFSTIKLGASADLAPGAESGLLATIGQYELLEEIARGGMGVVYKARQKGLNRIVALKMIIGGQFASREHVLRFRAEAEAAGQLRHPNIVAIHETGEVDGQPYFSMDFIEGRHLAELLGNGPLPGRRAAEYLRKIADAVHFAHEHGILHRDLKPSNILIDEIDEPRITDFGLAKRIQRESFITVTGQVLGSPQFMSPEQAIGGRKVGRTSDVYGLGGILYFVLTGRAPFAGESLDAILNKALHEQPVSPRMLNRSVPVDLETICLKCLEKEPQRRYATARDLAGDLERFLHDEPILARPATRAERGWRWCRRNPALTSLSASLAVLLGALVLLSLREPQTVVADFRPSLAVLFTAGDDHSRALRDWFSGELIRDLSRFSGLRVLPPNEVHRFEQPLDQLRAAGRLPQADAVLAGAVTKTGENTFDLSIEVLRLQPEEEILEHWLTRGKTSEAERIQVTIMKMVAGELELKLTEAEKALLRRRSVRNAGVFKHYMDGLQNRDRLNSRAASQALEDFTRAIELDPNDAKAYVGLAETHIDFAYFGWGPHSLHFEAARTNLNRALQIDPTLPDGLISEGVLKYFYDWDWNGSLKGFQRAMTWDVSRVEVHTCYFHILAAVGRPEEAREAVARAHELSPNSFRLASERACLAYYLGRFEEAERFWRQSRALEPDSAYACWGLGRTLEQMGRSREALEVLREGRSMPGGDWSGLVAETGYTLARMDERQQVESVLAELRERKEQEYLDYLYAMIESGLGNTDQVFTHLEAACDKRSPWLHSFVLDPKFLHLREHPRYAQIAARLNQRIELRP